MLDVFKQIFSATVLHLINVILSVTTSGSRIPVQLQHRSADHDQCASYLVSVLMDSSLGVILVVLTLRAVLYYIRQNKLEKLEQGNYLDREGKILIRNYAYQTAIWIGANLVVN